MSRLRRLQNLQRRSVCRRLMLAGAAAMVLLSRVIAVAGPYADLPDANGIPSFQLMDAPNPAQTIPQYNANPQFLPAVAPPDLAIPKPPSPTLSWDTAGAAAPISTSPAPVHERFIESSWYTRIDYFHWNERADGADFVNEDGPLWTLGYVHRTGIERFRGEFFASQVHYKADIEFDDGTVEPLSSHTNYMGLRGEYDLLLEPDAWSYVSFFTGVGTRFWIRDLPDDHTASGNFVEGYQETWWTVYPYLGIETREIPGRDFQFYASGRIGFTAITLERATLNDVALYPKPGVIGQLEGGIRGSHLFLGAYFDGMTWQRSDVVRGWLQPNSRMYTVGLKTGFYF